MKIADKFVVSLFFAVLAAAVVVGIVSISGYAGLGSNEVTLRAESWNNGYVHLWRDLSDGPDAKYTDIADGTRCEKIDNDLYKFGSGDTAIYYYWINCNGRSGYVQTDQVQ